MIRSELVSEEPVGLGSTLRAELETRRSSVPNDDQGHWVLTSERRDRILADAVVTPGP